MLTFPIESKRCGSFLSNFVYRRSDCLEKGEHLGIISETILMLESLREGSTAVLVVIPIYASPGEEHMGGYTTVHGEI